MSAPTTIKNIALAHEPFLNEPDAIASDFFFLFFILIMFFLIDIFKFIFKLISFLFDFLFFYLAFLNSDFF